MSGNRGVVYTEPSKVEVQDIAKPECRTHNGRRIDHAVILEVLSTNICGCGTKYPGAADSTSNQANLSIHFGLSRTEAQSFNTGRYWC